jgi:hypothetical protein
MREVRAIDKACHGGTQLVRREGMVEGDRREDELEPLPPIDGDGKEPPEGEGDFGDLLDESSEDATLDDSTAEDDPPDVKDLDLDDAEGSVAGDAAEAHDLDLGDDAAIADFGEESASKEETEEVNAENDEDYGLAEGPERGGLDGGDEGPLDADEELRDADLPALDADEEGDLDDAALVDAGFASDEPLGLPWAATPWLRVGAPVSLVGATAVVCAPRGAIAAGRGEEGAPELVHVDLEGSCEHLPADGLGQGSVVSLAADGPVVAVVQQSGRLLFSLDGGRSFSPIAEPSGEGVLAAVDAVFAQGRLWVRTRSGGLVALDVAIASSDRSPTRPRTVRPRERPAVERCAVPGAASGLTLDSGVADGAPVALVVDEVGRPTALVHPSGTVPARCEAVEAPAASSPPLFAVRGEHVAYAARHRGVLRRTGAGPWIWFEWEGRVTAMTFVDDAGTLVASTYSDADDTSALVQLDPAGKATVVARTGPSPTDSESDGRVASLAYDDARGVVWLAGGFGVASFARAR